jgi:hypothetical protein
MVDSSKLARDAYIKRRIRGEEEDRDRKPSFSAMVASVLDVLHENPDENVESLVDKMFPEISEFTRRELLRRVQL